METHDSNRESLLGGRDWDTAAAGTLGEALLAQEVPPEEVETLFQEGVDQLESGQNEQALAIFDRVLEFDPNHYKAWINRGSALANLKQLEAAIASYDRVLELKPDDFKAWNSRAAALNNLKRYQEALESAERGIALQPEQAHGWYVKGYALDGLRRFEEAIASHDKAIELDPNYLYSWNGRGGSLNDLGRFEEAIASYDKAIELDPNSLYSWYWRGKSLSNLGRLEEAIASYDRALELNPDDFNVWNSRAAALNNLKRYQEALESVERGIALQPEQAHGWYVKGYALDRLRRFEEAIASYDRALSLKPDYHLAWINRGLAMLDSVLAVNQGWSNPTLVAESLPPEMQNPDLNLRGYEGCLACFQEGFKYVAEGSEASGELHQWMGEAHQRWGNCQDNPRPYWREAIACYKQALKIFTADTFPQARLEVLELLIPTYRALQGDDDEVAAALVRQGTDLLKRILRESPSDAQKQRLGLQFASFEQATVDLLVQQGKLVEALETAEKDKNWLMTWMLRWQDPEDIPTASYDAMRQLLCADTAIVYWHLSADALTTFILRQDRPQPTVIDCARDDSQAGVRQINRFYSWLEEWNQTYNRYTGKDDPNRDTTWRENLPTMLSKLSDVLDIAQVNMHLENISQLILIPHRDLHRLPLHYLFPDRTCSYLPSAYFGQTLQQKSLERSPFQSLLLVENPQHRPTSEDDGTPSKQKKLDALPFAEVEAALIHRLFIDLGGEVLHLSEETDEKHPTQTQLIEYLSEQPCQVLHFNGHGAYNSKNPSQSCLFLSGSDRLTLRDIVSLDLSAYQLVSLATCEAAVTGNQTITAEYVGLVSAFLSARVGGVISTLWKVESAATAIFMVQFYRELQQGRSPILSLKAAQTFLQTATCNDLIQWFDAAIHELPRSLSPLLEDRRNRIEEDRSTMMATEPPYQHPYYWAAFTLAGL